MINNTQPYRVLCGSPAVSESPRGTLPEGDPSLLEALSQGPEPEPGSGWRGGSTPSISIASCPGPLANATPVSARRDSCKAWSLGYCTTAVSPRVPVYLGGRDVLQQGLDVFLLQAMQANELLG